MQSIIASIVYREPAFYLQGGLSSRNVMAILQESIKLFEQITTEELIIDLSELKTSDSTGLALLLEWIKYANRHEKKIWFDYFPAVLLSIVTAARLTALFSDNRRR